MKGTWSSGLVILVTLALFGMACAPQAPPSPPPKAALPASGAAEAKPAAASPAKALSRDELLKPLIEAARPEGELVVTGITSAGNAGAQEIGKAFNAAFGLNLRVKYDAEGQSSVQQTRAITEFKTGVPPTYDVVQGVTETMFDFCSQGACEPIENWQQLLPPGVPHEVTSPDPLAGLIFKFADRTKGIVYNPKVIQAAELPRTTRELGDPRFKDKFYTAPWLTAWHFGALVYPKDEWLKMLEAIGENKATTLQGAAGMKRLALGEFAFEAMANGYQHFEAEAVGDPSALSFFTDFVPVTAVYHYANKRARHPNAARLFVLWATGPEFNQVFEAASTTGNLSLPTSRSGQIEAKLIKGLGARVLRWEDNREAQDLLVWYTTTEEGKEYQSRMSLALKVK